MRIDDTIRLSSTALDRVNPNGAERALQPSNPSSDGDHASISPLAKALEGTSDDRLEALRLQVQSGRYHVPATELASDIIAENFHT